MYEVLKADIDRAKRLKRLTNADIAKGVGKKTSTIDAFMTFKGGRENKKLAEDIARFLGINYTEQEV